MSRILILGLLVAGFAGPIASHAAEDAPASSFVSLRYDGVCDDKNNRLWLDSTHTYKTIIVRVRWRAAGGKDISEEFFPAPGSMRELGCAAEAEILGAQYADF